MERVRAVPGFEDTPEPFPYHSSSGEVTCRVATSARTAPRKPSDRFGPLPSFSRFAMIHACQIDKVVANSHLCGCWVHVSGVLCCCGNAARTEFATLPGYWPNLDDEQLDALLQMCELWSKLENKSDAGENIVLLLLRFLRARSFDVTRAWEMLAQDMRWRTERGVEHFRSRTADDILQCSAAETYTYFPTVGCHSLCIGPLISRSQCGYSQWLQGFDKQGRPVAYRQYGNFEIWELLKLTSMERLLDFHIWEIEQQVSLLNKQTEAANCTVETFLIVMDAKDWSLRLATRDAYAYIRGMAEIDNTHFPERLGKVRR